MLRPAGSPARSRRRAPIANSTRSPLQPPPRSFASEVNYRLAFPVLQTISRKMSDPTQGVRSGLQGRVNNDLDILLKRFESIVQLASADSKDRAVTAAEAYQIECHASSMIRAAEDLLALTRSLKEAWMFGQLGSELGVVDESTDQNAKVVGEALQKLATEEIGGLEK